MTSTDLLQERAKECRRLASAARDAGDRAFWLELVERWKAVESRSARLHCLRQGPLAADMQNHTPGRRGKTAGARPALNGSSQLRSRQR
jgi:hypothetical protein